MCIVKLLLYSQPEYFALDSGYLSPMVISNPFVWITLLVFQNGLKPLIIIHMLGFCPWKKKEKSPKFFPHVTEVGRNWEHSLELWTPHHSVIHKVIFPHHNSSR